MINETTAVVFSFIRLPAKLIFEYSNWLFRTQERFIRDDE